MGCRKCGGNHFNFVPCDVHAEKQAELARRERSPERFLRPREGERDFGNRLHSSEARGNVVRIPRKNHPLNVARPRWQPEGGIVEYPSIFPDEAA